jgi:alanine racemase
LGINEKHNLGISAGNFTINEMENSKNNSANHWNLTNIGTAHDEGFEDVAEKLKKN